MTYTQVALMQAPVEFTTCSINILISLGSNFRMAHWPTIPITVTQSPGNLSRRPYDMSINAYDPPGGARHHRLGQFSKATPEMVIPVW
jgi:hypothetical protein